LSPHLSHAAYQPAYTRLTPSNSGQRSPPTSYRGCWHVVSRGFLDRYRPSSSRSTGLYRPKPFITHAASLAQPFGHWRRSLTAAPRRSLGRFSVPVWPAILSDQLPITGLVGHYPTNHLMGREPPLRRLLRNFPLWIGPKGSCGISHPFGQLSPTNRLGRSRVTHPSAANSDRSPSPLDLHVLRTPPAFVLSQDQTLRSKPAEAGRVVHILTVAMRHRDQHSVASLPRTDPFQGCSNIPLFSCQGALPALARRTSTVPPASAAVKHPSCPPGRPARSAVQRTRSLARREWGVNKRAARRALRDGYHSLGLGSPPGPGERCRRQRWGLPARRSRRAPLHRPVAAPSTTLVYSAQCDTVPCRG
jgi:hypothetical protein